MDQQTERPHPRRPENPVPVDHRKFLVRESDGVRLDFWEAEVGDRVWVYNADGTPEYDNDGTQPRKLLVVAEVARPMTDEERAKCQGSEPGSVQIRTEDVPGSDGTAPPQEPRPEWCHDHAVIRAGQGLEPVTDVGAANRDEVSA